MAILSKNTTIGGSKPHTLASLPVSVVGNELTFKGNKVMLTYSKKLGKEENLNDLNDTKHAGVYIQPLNANATLDKNYPIELSGTLVVLDCIPVVQIYYTYNRSTMYIRGLHQGKFSKWEQSANQSDLSELKKFTENEISKLKKEKWDVQETIGNGKVMKEGAYGIGTMASPAVPSGHDMNEKIANGFYRLPNSIVNAPNWQSSGDCVIYNGWDKNNWSALVLGKEMGLKTASFGKIGDWKTFYSDSNTTLDKNGFVRGKGNVESASQDDIKKLNTSKQDKLEFVGDKDGKVMREGAYGIGGYRLGEDGYTEVPMPSGVYNTMKQSLTAVDSGVNHELSHAPVPGQLYGGIAIPRALRPCEFGVSGRGNNAKFHFRGFANATSDVKEWQTVYSDFNTTIDSSGFLRATGNENALVSSQNLKDVANVTTARSNLGLGNSAIRNMTSSLGDSTTLVASQRLVNNVNNNVINLKNDSMLKVKSLGTINIDTLNSESDCGFYWQTSNANATTARGYPTNLAGSLQVLPGLPVIQIYTTYNNANNSKMYSRGYYGKWYDWIPYAKDTDLEDIKKDLTSEINKVKSTADNALSIANKKWDVQLTTGTGNIARMSEVTTAQNTANDARTRAINAQTRADQAYNLAGSSKIEGNIVFNGGRKLITLAKGGRHTMAETGKLIHMGFSSTSHGEVGDVGSIIPKGTVITSEQNNFRLEYYPIKVI